MTNNQNLPISNLNDYMQTMETVANNQQSLDDIKMLTSDKVTDQLKVFLIAQARNELQRVVSLTKFLDRVETNFINKVDDAMLNSDLTLKQYSDIINIIAALLLRSNEIISKVLKDDSLTTILNTTIYQGSTQDASNNTSVITQLTDAQSREKVRIVVQQILKRAEDYTPETIVVEPEEEEEEDITDGITE